VNFTVLPKVFPGNGLTHRRPSRSFLPYGHVWLRDGQGSQVGVHIR
jgi:hypothetical protein